MLTRHDNQPSFYITHYPVTYVDQHLYELKKRRHMATASPFPVGSAKIMGSPNPLGSGLKNSFFLNFRVLGFLQLFFNFKGF